MGVIGYQLTYGHHPFKFAANPWRQGNEYERLRPSWQDKYDKAIAMLSMDHERWTAQKVTGRDQGYLHGEWKLNQKRGERGENHGQRQN